MAVTTNNSLCPPHNFPVWKTIKLGTGLVTPDDFYRELIDNGFRTSDSSKDIFGKPSFVTSDIETLVDLVLISSSDIGLKNGATRKNFYNRVYELGLELCPPELGPQLRLQYPDQPHDELIIIGMEPIVGRGGHLNIFGLSHDDSGCWINAYISHPNNWYDTTRHFVFVLP